MNRPDLPFDFDSPESLHRQQCLLYLLGELSSTEQTEFEAELSRSPRLGEHLLEQANCLCELSEASVANQAIDIRSRVCTENGHTDQRWLTRPRLIAAIAAGLLLTISASIYRATDTDTFSAEDRLSVDIEHDPPADPLLVAQVWAESNLIDDRSTDGVELVGDEDAGALGDDDSDASFDWIYSAVVANPEVLVEGDSYEG